MIDIGATYKQEYKTIPTVKNAPRLSVPENIFRPKNLAMACEMAGITVDEAKGPRMDRATAQKRQHAMAIMREWGKTYPLIGRTMNRDHSTIVHGVKRHKARMAKASAE